MTLVALRKELRSRLFLKIKNVAVRKLVALRKELLAHYAKKTGRVGDGDGRAVGARRHDVAP
jgi:hypothetical protein